MNIQQISNFIKWAILRESPPALNEGPYRQIDRSSSRQAAIMEARRVRDALLSDHTFYNIGNGKIRSSDDIADALDRCIDELSL